MTTSPFVIEVGDMCHGCGLCVTHCGRGNFTLEEGRRLTVKEGYVCTGCGECVKWCPVHAVRVRPVKSVAIRRCVR